MIVLDYICLIIMLVIFLALAGFRAYFRDTEEHVFEAIADALSKMHLLGMTYILYIDFWWDFCACIVNALGK